MRKIDTGSKPENLQNVNFPRKQMAYNEYFNGKSLTNVT